MALTILTQFAPAYAADISSGAVAVVSLSQTGGVAMCVTAAQTALSAGDWVTISGATPSGFNGTFVVVSIVNGTTFTFAISSGTSSPATGTITLTCAYAGLGTITGTLHTRAGGPKVSGDTSAGGNGWSMDLRLISNQASGNNIITYAGMTTPSGAATLGCFSTFYYINKYHGGSAGCQISAPVIPFVNATLVNSGNFAYEIAQVPNNWVVIDSGVAYPMRQWFESRFAWSYNSSTHIVQLVWAYRICGTSSWVTIVTGSYNISTWTGGVTPLYLGTNNNGGGSSAWYDGRFGMPVVCSMGSFADATTLLSTVGIVDPPANPSYPWLLDPNNYSGIASDSGDGIATPFLTAAKVSTESRWAGFFAPATAWQTATNGVASGTGADLTQDATVLRDLVLGNQIAITGDTLTINNAGQAEIPITGSLTIDTDGMWVKSSGGTGAPAWLTHFKKILPASWTLVSGKTNTYSCTDTAAAVVLWENRCAMNHPLSKLSVASLTQSGGTATCVTASAHGLTTGNTSYVYGAAVGAYNGSFTVTVTNSTTFTYAVASGTAGTAGGTIYETSYNLVAASLESTPNSAWTDGVTMYAHASDSSNPGTNGNRYERSQVNGAGPVGLVMNGANLRVTGIGFSGTTLTDPAVGGAIGGYGIGADPASASPALAVYEYSTVDYCDKHGFGSVGTGINGREIYLFNVAQRANPVAGGGGFTAYVCYSGTGSGNQAAFWKCTNGLGIQQIIGSSGATVVPANAYASFLTHGVANGWSKIDISHCDFSKGGNASAQNGAVITGNYSAFGSTPFNGTYTGCIFYNASGPNGTYNSCIFIPTSGGNFQYYEPSVLNYCTLDLSGLNSTWLVRIGAQSLTFNNSVIIPGANQVTNGYASGDTLQFTGCEIQGATSLVVAAGDTLAQLTTAGHATGSVMVATAPVDSINNYIATGQSVVTSDGGALADFTGVVFSHRQTGGAYEWVPGGGVGRGMMQVNLNGGTL